MIPDGNANDLCSQALSLTSEILAFSLRSPHLGYIERERIYADYESKYLDLLVAFRHREG